MVIASQLRAGMAVRFEGQPYKVVACEYRPGQGRMGGAAHARLKNLETGTYWEHSFRAELKLETLPVEKHSLEFLYSDADHCYFMDPDTYEQLAIPLAVAGQQAKFLEPQMKLPVESSRSGRSACCFPTSGGARCRHRAAGSCAGGQRVEARPAGERRRNHGAAVHQVRRSDPAGRGESEYVDRAKGTAH